MRSEPGFEVPLLHWLKNELGQMIKELLNDDFIEEQQLFNVDEIPRMRQMLHSKNPGDVASRLWALIVFQYWYKKYIL